MSQLPPLPPLSYATPPQGEDVRAIASRQRGVVLCILGYFVLAALLMTVHAPVLSVLILIALLGVVVTGAVFAFMLSIALYNTATGIVLGILTLIPLVGLITLVCVNMRATNVLRRHGIRVGLLGADMAQIPM